MDKIWLKNYPEGVPAEIDLSRYRSLKDLIEECLTEFKSYTAYYNMGARLSYGDVDQKSRYFGAFLQKVAQLEKGDRVAIMMPNLLQYPVAAFGVLRAGMVVVNVNPLYTPRELEHQLKDSGAKAVVICENFADTLQEVIEHTEIRTVITTEIGDLFPTPKRQITNFVIKHVKKMVPAWNIPDTVPFCKAINEGKWQALDDVELNHDDIAFLQYTGGTTGLSKGAMLTHGNMVANVLQAGAWLGTLTRKGEEIVITALPLYHIFALTANCFVFLMLGGENVLITNPRDFPGFVKELKKHKFTAITGVNTLFNALLNTPGFSDIDFSHLRLDLAGGMAVQHAVAEHWKQVTGVTLIEAYGLTETSPAAAINPLTNTEYNGSIGLPLPSTEFTILDDAGTELRLGEIGELCVRGPQVMAGYWNRPKETANVMVHGDWLRTGDMGRMDENGYIYIEDRKKDMILVSGFNVYPNEIESVVVEHPGVLEAAVVGIPDEHSGEVVKLFVVRKDPNLTKEDLLAYCRENLTGYKRPQVIEFRDELPKTNVGKILRRALRDEEVPAEA